MGSYVICGHLTYWACVTCDVKFAKYPCYDVRFELLLLIKYVFA